MEFTNPLNLIKPKQANVGLFNDCFPPVMDGVSVCMENYAYWLQKMVGDVKVITPKVPGTDYDKLPYEVLSYFSVPVPKRPPYVTGIAEVDPSFLSGIIKMRFRIVHAHCPFGSGSVAQRISKIQGIPLIATFHSKYRDDFSRVFPKAVVDVIIKYIIDFYENADLVWVPQESVIEVMREYGFKGNVEVMDNGSDLVADYSEEFFANARKQLGIKPEEFVLLFVGQHIWEKNPRLVIESLARMKDVPFRMFFVGRGYAEKEMQELVEARGLSDKVTFTGNIGERDVLTRYYAAADLFLFPSLYDNAPLVVREAAALHTASVMAEGATASTIIRDGQNGFLVENTVESMEARLRALAADRDLVRRAGMEASRTIVRSWEDCVAEALERYNMLLKIRNLPIIEKI